MSTVSVKKNPAFASDADNVKLSKTMQQQIDHWLAKYPKDQRQSALLPALTIAQDEYGWLPDSLIRSVAEYLKIPAIAAFEAATFYSMYDLHPVGKYKIDICTNVSCMLQGSDNLVKHLERKLGIAIGETTEDGKFSLRSAECLAACINAPAMQMNKTFYENLTPEKLDELIDGLE